jgi:hypothetical protein
MQNFYREKKVVKFSEYFCNLKKTAQSYQSPIRRVALILTFATGNDAIGMFLLRNGKNVSDYLFVSLSFHLTRQANALM